MQGGGPAWQGIRNQEEGGGQAQGVRADKCLEEKKKFHGTIRLGSTRFHRFVFYRTVQTFNALIYISIFQ